MVKTTWSSNRASEWGKERGFKWLLNIEWLLVPDGLVWVFQKTADLRDFNTTISRVYREWSEKRKYPMSGSCVDVNSLLMSEVRGEWGRLVRNYRKATVTQITTRTTKVCRIHLWTHNNRTLKQMGYSSRRPHRVTLLSAKNRKRRLQFTQAQQNWTIEDRKMLPGLKSLDFCCNIQMVGSEFGVKNMKAWIHPACLNGSGWWWCNGVGDIFLAHFGLLSTNWALFKHHGLPE